jgi:dienelactone hydrolase
MRFILGLFLVINFSLFSQNTYDLSLRFIKHLEKQAFDSCYMMFDTIISNKISSDMLSQTWSGMTRYMGDYKTFSSITSERHDTLEISYVRCEFEKSKIDLQLVFNSPPNKIIGMFFSPPKNQSIYNYPSYVAQNSYYENKLIVENGNVKLPGILCVPNHVVNPPVVLLLAGSGPNDKDETIGPNKLLKDLACGLASLGIATYRYDKRTLVYKKEASINAEKINIYDEVIDDALCAIKMLKKQPNLKKSKLFVVGHSLGAMCAPLIADKSKYVNGIILLAGNARPLEDIVLEQYKYIFGLDSIDTLEQKELNELNEQIIKLKQAKNISTIKREDLPLGLSGFYWNSLKQYNQLETAQKIKHPILVLQGEKDYQVTMTDFNLWKENLTLKSNTHFISYDNLNHLFMKTEKKSVPSDYEKPGNVDFKIIKDIQTWILENQETLNK